MAITHKHVVAFPCQAWGHARPLIHLSARLVKLRPVNVTLLTTNSYFDRVSTELARAFETGEEECAQRIRIVSIGDAWFLKSDEDHEHFKNAWRMLVNAEGLVCARTNTRHPPLPRPRGVVVDLFAVDYFDSIKNISGDSIKIYGWAPALVYSIISLFGPEHIGGKGNIRIHAEDETRRTGRSYNEAVMDICFKPEGKVIRIPGMAPMYDHEYHPQDYPVPEDVAVHILPRVYENLEASDGALLFTPDSYEPKAVAAAKEWFAETGRKAYACGPLLPPASVTAAANEQKLSSKGSEIQTFLDATLESSGKRSLLYISLGSIFWPIKTPEKLWAFLDVVMELNIPFIMSHASPLAFVPREVRQKVKAYGRGLLSLWTPQQLLLDHPATGWYVSHGGHNGITEAISAGVPQILWPFCGDQPLNAVHISDNLQIGYELLEVRTGHGLKPIYRTGYTPVGTVEALKAETRTVLTNAFGEDGMRKRERLEVLRRAVRSEWDVGGSSRRDVVTFIDSL